MWCWLASLDRCILNQQLGNHHIFGTQQHRKDTLDSSYYTKVWHTYCWHLLPQYHVTFTAFVVVLPDMLPIWARLSQSQQLPLYCRCNYTTVIWVSGSNIINQNKYSSTDLCAYGTVTSPLVHINPLCSLPVPFQGVFLVSPVSVPLAHTPVSWSLPKEIWEMSLFIKCLQSDAQCVSPCLCLMELRSTSTPSTWGQGTTGLNWSPRSPLGNKLSSYEIEYNTGHYAQW